MEDYAPLVEYQQNKDFVGLMGTLMDVVEKLQERNNLTDGEYLDMSNLCKKLYDAKAKVEKHIVYVEMVRRAQKKPPQPPKEVDKLNDENYTVCEFCDKPLHKKYVATHQRTSKTCLRHRQAKRSCAIEKLSQFGAKHTLIQAHNLQLRERYITKEIETKKNSLGKIINPKDILAGTAVTEEMLGWDCWKVIQWRINTLQRQRRDIGYCWLKEEDGGWIAVNNPNHI